MDVTLDSGVVIGGSFVGSSSSSAPRLVSAQWLLLYILRPRPQWRRCSRGKDCSVWPHLVSREYGILGESLAFPRAKKPRTKFSPGDPPAHLEAQETGAAPPFPRVTLPCLVRSGRKPSSLGLVNERRRRPDLELLRCPALRPSSSNAPPSPGPPPATGSGAPPISLHLHAPPLWRGRRRPRSSPLDLSPP